MSDVLNATQRSYCMSRIRGHDTGPELILRKALWRRGIRYRLRYKLVGNPDITFVSGRLAVFVDGCFWHGCQKHSVWPKTNAEFWRSKIEKNMERDRTVSKKLGDLGWQVVRVWEHSITEDVDLVVDELKELISRSKWINCSEKVIQYKYLGCPNLIE